MPGNDSASSRRRCVCVCGTFDTKGPELRFLADRIVRAGVDVRTVDVSTRPHRECVDVTARTVASFHPGGEGAVLSGADRGQAIAAMADAFAGFITAKTDLVGVIGAGGSGGTALLAPGFRALPAGLPKGLEDCPPQIDAFAKAARRYRPDMIVLCHGGPIATPADAQYVIDACHHCDGFYGASSMERLPVETALTDRTREFRALRRTKPHAKEVRA